MKKLLIAIAVLCLSAPAGAAWSKAKAPDASRKEVLKLRGMNVTAKRSPQEEIETPSFTTVLDEDAIARSGTDDAYELLRDMGGVNFSAQLPGGASQGGMNGEIGVRGIRGGELIMLNGMPIIGPTSGTYDLDMIPSAFLERVELVKGAGSTLYGSRAMTGVVSMRTKRPGKPGTGGSLLYGSHGKVDGSAWFRNETVFAGASYSRFDAIDNAKVKYGKRRPYNLNMYGPRKYAAMASLRFWRPLTLNYMFNYSKTGYMLLHPKSSSSDYEQEQKIFHNYLSADYQRDAFKASLFLHQAKMKVDYDYTSAAKPNRKTDRTTYTAGLDAQNSYDWGAYRLLYGLTFLHEIAHETRENLKGSKRRGYYLQTVDSDHTREQASLFSQLDYTFLEKFTLTGGLRLQGVFADEDDRDDYLEALPQVQGLYRMNARNSLYINVGRAMRTPTFHQLYADSGSFFGNADLKPEYGWTYEAGWKTAHDNFSLTLSAFVMDYRDKIRYVYNDSAERYQAVNVDKFRTSGFEWDAALRLNEYFVLSFAGYVADPWENNKGLKQQAGPRTQFAPGIGFKYDRLAVNLRAEVLAQRERNLDDYANVHLNASYRLTDWLRLRFKADNLLDKDLVVYGNMTPGASSVYEVFDRGMWVYGGVEIDFSLL